MSPVRPDLVECWIYRLPEPGRVELLLIRRSASRLFPGLWQCVTGGLEAGERVPAAALRPGRPGRRRAPPGRGPPGGPRGSRLRARGDRTVLRPGPGQPVLRRGAGR